MCQGLKHHYIQSTEHLPLLTRSTERSTVRLSSPKSELTPKSHDEAGFYTTAIVQNDMTVV